MRTVIVGPPGCGKTTLAKTMDSPRHCDETIDLGWSEASEAISYWFDDPGPWTIEGVQTVRALRKWLKRNEAGKPTDQAIYMTHMYEDPSPGDLSMAKGIQTVWNEIVNDLISRQVTVSYR